MHPRALIFCGLIVLAMAAACGSASNNANNAADTDTATPTHTAAPASDTAATTAAPTATPTPAGPPLGDEQVVAEAGYAFRPLADWTVDVQGGVAGMRPPDAAPEAGPSIAMTVGDLEELNIEEISSQSIETSQDFFEAVRSGMQRETQGITFEEPQSITIDGYEAYTAPFQSTGFGNLETEVAGQVSAALLEERRGFVMFGIATPPDQWQHSAEYAAIHATIRILPIPTPTPTPATTATPTPTD